MDLVVMIEIPQGTRNKDELDRRTGRIRLDRTLFTATDHPADHGFVEHSPGEDTDPPGALGLTDIADLEPFHELEIQHFSGVDQDLEPSRSVGVEDGSWAGRTEADAEGRRSLNARRTADHAAGVPA